MSKGKATTDVHPDAQDERPASSRLKLRDGDLSTTSQTSFLPFGLQTSGRGSFDISAAGPQSVNPLKSSSPIPTKSASVLLDRDPKKPFLYPSNAYVHSESEPLLEQEDFDPTTMRSRNFMENMAELNRALACWVNNCVKEDPTAILTPVFIDHQRQAQAIFDDERARTVSLDRLLVLRAQEKVLHGLKETADDSDEDSLCGETSLPRECSAVETVMPLINGTVTEDGAFSVLPKFSSLSPTAPKDTFNPFLKNNPIYDTKSSPTANVLGKINSADMFLPPKPSEAIRPELLTPLNKPTAGTGFLNAVVPEKSNSFMGLSFASACNEAAIKAAAAKVVAEEDINEDTPPKVEFTPVQEEGAVYTKRCKIYFKKEKEEGYEDRGIGNLFVKPVPSTNRHQLIVRADTSLGNLLVNVLLSPDIPVKKMDGKNIMLVMVPTPGSTLRTVMVRMKEGADEVVQMLTKFSTI